MTLDHDKFNTALAVLDYGWLTIHLRTDPDPALVIPAHLKRAKILSLQYGYDMPVSIPDLVVSTSGIYGTLSFGGVPFHCVVPWRYVYGCSDQNGRGKVWPESAPASYDMRSKMRLIKGGAKRSKPAIGVLKLVK